MLMSVGGYLQGLKISLLRFVLLLMTLVLLATPPTSRAGAQAVNFAWRDPGKLHFTESPSWQYLPRTLQPSGSSSPDQDSTPRFYCPHLPDIDAWVNPLPSSKAPECEKSIRELMQFGGGEEGIVQVWGRPCKRIYYKTVNLHGECYFIPILDDQIVLQVEFSILSQRRPTDLAALVDDFFNCLAED